MVLCYSKMQPTSRLLQLPAELRLQIYQHVLQDTTAMPQDPVATSKIIAREKQNIGLVVVNRLIREEALPMLVQHIRGFHREVARNSRAVRQKYEAYRRSFFMGVVERKVMVQEVKAAKLLATWSDPALVVAARLARTNL